MHDQALIKQYLFSLSADCDRAEWINICGAFKSAGGDFETFDQWSATAPQKYNAADCRTAWNSLTQSGNPDGAAGLLRKLAISSGKYFPPADPPREQQATVSPSPVIPQKTSVAPPLIAGKYRLAPLPAGGVSWNQAKNGDPEAIRSYINDTEQNKEETFAYFCEHRGLSPETVTAFRLGFDPADRAAIIPYPGEVYCVRRFIDQETDGHGAKYDNPKGKKPVFNAVALQQNTRPVFVCEGQIDALSIIDAGGVACTGLNEPGTFIQLATASQAPGFIAVGDLDEHGIKSADALKEKLSAAGKKCKTTIMLPGFHDVNALLRQNGREALKEWITKEENQLEPEETIAQAVTLRELQEKINAEGPSDPNELIKNRFICKGGAGVLAAETGCGKSSLVMQLCLHWGAGLPCFGLYPTRPLKILLIQAENDERDLQEEITGVCWGAANIELLAIPQIDAAKEAVRIISDSTHAGDNFVHMLEEVLEPGIDLIICDPLFAFAGCDLSNQEKVSRFLRNQINPLLKHYNVAALFVHHMAKSSKGVLLNENFNQAYNYHGSAEIINWARFALVLERFKDQSGNFFFKLSAPKRGRRLGWDKEAKYLRWCDRAIYWEELDAPPELAAPSEAVTPEARAAQRENDKRRRLLDDATRAAEILKPGESMTAADFRRAIIGRGITTNKSRLETILAICIENGFIIEREPTKEEKTIPGIKKMIERPALPPEQMELFSIAPNLG